MNKSFQEELRVLKMDRHKVSAILFDDSVALVNISQLLLMDHVLRFKLIAPVTVSEILFILRSFLAHLEGNEIELGVCTLYR